LFCPHPLGIITAGSGGGGGGGGVGAKPTQAGVQSAHIGSGEEDEENSETSSEEEEDEEGGVQATQGYNAADYANLQVSNEVKELFQYIGRYKPQTIELETKLKPFIPDYIPAIGEIDPFLKIPRPDGQPDKLGLTVLDEPAAQQTDPTVLDLQLRAISTQAALQPTVVPSIENAAANPQKITTWMTNMVLHTHEHYTETHIKTTRERENPKERAREKEREIHTRTQARSHTRTRISVCVYAVAHPHKITMRMTVWRYM